MTGRLPGSLLALCLCLISMQAKATPKSHEDATRKFFQAAKMDQVFDALAVQMTDAQIQANPILTPFRESIVAFLRKYMSWKELEPDMVKIYMQEFTEAEVKDMTKFYATATGQKVLKKMPELSAQGAVLGQKKLVAHAAEFQTILEEAQKKAEAAAKK